jgi:hypothetical protein
MLPSPDAPRQRGGTLRAPTPASLITDDMAVNCTKWRSFFACIGANLAKCRKITIGSSHSIDRFDLASQVAVHVTHTEPARAVCPCAVSASTLRAFCPSQNEFHHCCCDAEGEWLQSVPRDGGSRARRCCGCVRASCFERQQRKWEHQYRPCSKGQWRAVPWPREDVHPAEGAACSRVCRLGAARPHTVCICRTCTK